MIEIKKPLVLKDGEPEEIAANQAVPLAAALVDGLDIKVYEVFANRETNIWSLNYFEEWDEVHSVIPVIESNPDILFNKIALLSSFNTVAASGSIFSVNALAQALGIVGGTLNILTGGGLGAVANEVAPDSNKLYVTVVGKKSGIDTIGVQ